MARHGCYTLKQQFNASHGSTYLSPQIQNKLIQCIGDCIQKDIVAEVKEARFFSIFADEAADSANFEQMPLVLCYVNRDGIPCDTFIAFLQVEQITGAAIAESILQFLKDIGVPAAGIRGQGYGGASNMARKHQDCAAIIRNQFPQLCCSCPQLVCCCGL